MTKKSKFSHSKIFMHFFLIFDNLCGLERLKSQKNGCPVGASEEFSAVFQVKVSQINTGNGKEPKIFQFPKVLCIFC